MVTSASISGSDNILSPLTSARGGYFTCINVNTCTSTVCSHAPLAVATSTVYLQLTTQPQLATQAALASQMSQDRIAI